MTESHLKTQTKFYDEKICNSNEECNVEDSKKLTEEDNASNNHDENENSKNKGDITRNDDETEKETEHVNYSARRDYGAKQENEHYECNNTHK